MDIELSDDDEEIVEFLEWERRPYTVRNRVNHFQKWDNVDFFRRFRLKKETVLLVLERVEQVIETPTDRNHAIKPIDKVLLTLRFYALGTILQAAGDFVGVSKSSACKIIREVSVAIARLAPQYINMPSTEEDINNARLSFYRRARMPRVIGALDCTHIRIESPGGANSEVFRNRKGYFSLNVQTISSADLHILNIVARWPGSAHDQTVFDNSSINQQLHNNTYGNSLIVADSGYANTMHVITPLLNTRNAVEELYNEALIRTRNPVERLYGVWKRRFPILSLGLRLKIDTTMAVIVATAVLHNIACKQNEGDPPEDPQLAIQNYMYEEDVPQDLLNDRTNTQATARRQLIEDYFTTLL